MRALYGGVNVALPIDSDTMPYKVLLIRGSVRTDVVDGISPEYRTMVRRVHGEQWLDNMRPIIPEMAHIFITPRWVGILDFETRYPSALKRSMERAQSPGS